MFGNIWRSCSLLRLTCWKTECTSCRTEVPKFMHQSILIQHLTNYCCVVRIHGLIVIVSCRTSKQEVDKKKSITDLIIPNKKLALLTQKELYDSTEIVSNGIYMEQDLSYVFFAFWSDSGNNVSHHFHTNSKEMMSTKRARQSIINNSNS